MILKMYRYFLVLNKTQFSSPSQIFLNYVTILSKSF